MTTEALSDYFLCFGKREEGLLPLTSKLRVLSLIYEVLIALLNPLITLLCGLNKEFGDAP
jgi:hypothetical protein